MVRYSFVILIAILFSDPLFGKQVVVKTVKKTVRRIPFGGDGASVDSEFSKNFDLRQFNFGGSENISNKFEKHSSQKHISHSGKTDGISSKVSGGKWRKGKNGEMIYEKTVITESTEGGGSDGWHFKSSWRKSQSEGSGEKSHKRKNARGQDGMISVVESRSEYDEDESIGHLKDRRRHKLQDQQEGKLKRKGGFIFNMEEDEERSYSSGGNSKKGQKVKKVYESRSVHKKSNKGAKGSRSGFMMDIETTVDTMHRWEDVDSVNFCGEKGWNEFNGHCYKIITRSFTASQAQKACEEEDAHLASIHTSLENDFISMLTAQLDYSNRNIERGIWIGMTRKPANDNKFRTEWHDKSGPVFGLQEHNHPAPNKFPWRVGQPDNSHGDEWCVHIYPFYNNNGHSHHSHMSQWNDFNCEERMDASVCKKNSRCAFGEGEEVNEENDDDAE